MKTKLALIFSTLTLLEIAFRLLFPRLYPDLYEVRSAMLGKGFHSENTQNVSPHPYLNYELYPGYKNEFGVQHNELGFRGPALPFKKPDNTFRVLFLGESTTYGMYIPKADETHPAFVEKLFAQNPVGKQRVEVINAGVPSATSAEMILHYHFKYSFFKPDLVVIDLGGNDSVSLEYPNYQPDYSNWRTSLRKFQEVTGIGKILFQSRFFSFVYLSLQYGLHPSPSGIIRTDGQPPLVQWYNYPEKNTAPLREEDWGFFHNLNTLVSLAKQNGSQVLLVPFRYNPRNDYTAAIRKTMERSVEAVKKIAQTQHVAYADFPSGTISPQYFVDNCHFSAPGALQKAKYLYPFLRKILESKK